MPGGNTVGKSGVIGWPNSASYAFAKLMRLKGVNEHLVERLARIRLPVSPLVSVILEEVPTWTRRDYIPRLRYLEALHLQLPPEGGGAWPLH